MVCGIYYNIICSWIHTDPVTTGWKAAVQLCVVFILEGA